MTLNSLRASTFLGALVLLGGSAQAQLSAVTDGYQLTGSNSFTELCSDSPSYGSLIDGSYVVFDGYDIEHRSAGGALIRRFASLPAYKFPSFVRIAPDGSTAYIGESSSGQIWSVDLGSGGLTALANLTFNFDLAFDTDPGFAYVSAATGGFGFNSVHRMDLSSGATTEVASVTGFSGPLAVDDFGDVLLARLSGQFPAPAGSADILRFDDADLDGGTVLSEADATVSFGGLNGCSSLQYDMLDQQYFLMETSAGASGFGSELWRIAADGTPLEQVAESTVFSGGIEIVDAGIGTRFGPYQPNYVGLRFVESDCFGSGTTQRVSVRPLRPAGTFSGPFQGTPGNASFVLDGGIPGGFASLWLARSGSFSPADIVTDQGGLFPIALRATASSFGRRFPMVPLDASGHAQLDFVQDPVFEGALLAQWLVYDAAGSLVTSSTFAINRSAF